jgi:hypothetical protein
MGFLPGFQLPSFSHIISLFTFFTAPWRRDREIPENIQALW